MKSLVATKGYEGTPIYSRDGLTIAFVSDGGNPTWGGANNILRCIRIRWANK